MWCALLDRMAGDDPRVEPAEEWSRSGVAPIEQQSRRLCRRCFVGTRAVQDDLSIARQRLGASLDRIQRDCDRAGDTPRVDSPSSVARLVTVATLLAQRMRHTCDAARFPRSVDNWSQSPPTSRSGYGCNISRAL
jgi:hypothetical protein